jgi:hypothetical protein
MVEGQLIPHGFPNFNFYVENLRFLVFCGWIDRQMDRQTETLIRCGLGFFQVNEEIFGAAEPHFGNNRIMGEMDRNALTNNWNTRWPKPRFSHIYSGVTHWVSAKIHQKFRPPKFRIFLARTNPHPLFV